jgi:hypothetical protein
MRFAICLIFAAAGLTGCASALPHFQKAAPGGLGYAISTLIAKNGFTVTTELGPKANEKYSIYYGYRVVGEECLARNFSYFDVAVVSPHEFEGYCYKTPDHPALGVEFQELGLASRPQRFVVGSLNQKTKTLLEKGDEIQMIDQTVPTSVATFKGAVFRASAAGHKTVDLKIFRGDVSQEIKEPIALFKDSSMGSTQLDLFRSRVN